MKKTMLILTAIIVAQCSTAFRSSASSLPGTGNVNVPPSFNFLRVHETGSGYNLQWKLNSNSSVQAFVIECTYEDPTDPYSVWEMRGRITLSNGVNMFRDKNLLPGIINYRITAVNSSNAPVAISDILTFTVE